MSSRRFFLKSSLTGLVLAGVAPVVSAVSPIAQDLLPQPSGKLKLRLAIASDGHYGQPGTPYKRDHENMVKWLNQAHEASPLDFVIINGDLVHDQPELLSEVKKDYYDHLKVPFYAIPGNHDHADTARWKAVFGYEDNFSFEKNGIGFILANTSDTSGKYLAPNADFMSRELEKFKALKTVFVVLHIPPHSWVPENPFVDSPETISLLHRYPNVKAVFHGHDHSLDAVFYTSKLPHFFDAHIGGSWGTSYRGYRIVEVDQNDKIRTYQVKASAEPVLNQTML
ncbi:metallophosphoesterase family protein [Pedobacter nutrimenti]|jgi:3',5'-cyclic AMP phosphodiesterase CpdA|uniref:3',5'-cyclic AMP phosphodiesterase CpdA n=1 Tax=Pedobacter nutrimenti TaxID=1241337 RepID=A0A318ULM0_9SPHI|nr:metallophosphoesterase [Pedobacter nutrimenti]PYF74945.1 3',5'-cyclic AMP phosphodiesterase CpdA [Pedobacter nutrimenti]